LKTCAKPPEIAVRTARFFFTFAFSKYSAKEDVESHTVSRFLFALASEHPERSLRSAYLDTERRKVFYYFWLPSGLIEVARVSNFVENRVAFVVYR
jgi:hypothetical protein